MKKATFHNLTKGAQYKWYARGYVGTPIFFFKEGLSTRIDKLPDTPNKPPIERILDTPDYPSTYAKAEYTGNIYVVELFPEDLEVVSLKREDGVTVVIQTCFYSFFKKFGDFYISSVEKAPVFVVKEGEIMGGVMPVYTNKKYE